MQSQTKILIHVKFPYQSSFSLKGFFFISLLMLMTNFIACSSNTTVKPVSQIQIARDNYGSVKFQDTSMILIGDSITFSVWGEPEFLTHATVRSTGTISIPLIGEIKAAGNSRKDFEIILRKRLAEFIQGEIKLTLEISSPLPKITFLGAIGRQGSFPAKDEIGLLEAFSSVGGWGENADLSNILITRQTTNVGVKKSITVDLEEYFEKGMVQELPYLYPGDVVFVPIRENFVRSMSEFMQNALILFGFFGLTR
jgi:polysaccharide biosynthesis/export protein